MAITRIEEYNNTLVLRLGSDDDDYATLVAAQTDSALAGAFNTDSTITEIVRLNDPLYLAEGVGVTFRHAFIVFDDGSAVTLEKPPVDHIDGDQRNGVRFEDSMIIMNPKTRPPGVDQVNRTQWYINPHSIGWLSIKKNQTAPLQLHNSTLMFTVSEHDDSNQMPISYAVGDGIGACKIIRNVDLTAANDRLFIANLARIINTDIFNWREVVFNDLLQNVQVESFENVRIFGNTLINHQGPLIYQGLRLHDNTEAQPFIGYYGSNNTSRRALACYINMTPYLDGGHGSSNIVFPFFQHNNAVSLRDITRYWLNEFEFTVKALDGTAVEGASLVAFIKYYNDEIAQEMALDFTARYRAYFSNTVRYGEITSTEWTNAGTNLANATANGHLTGQSELITNAEGRTIVSGEDYITNPQLRLCEVKFIEASWQRRNYSEQKFRVMQYGKLTQEVTPTLGADTLEDASNEEVIVILLDDMRLTESDRTVVADYTEVTDLNQMYDYIRHLEYEQRDNPYMTPMTYDGPVMEFPAGTELRHDATIATPIQVTYSAGIPPVYRFKSNVPIQAPDNFNFSSLDLTSTGGTDLSWGVSITDARGTSIVITTPTGADTLLYVEEVKSNGTSDYRTLTENGTFDLYADLTSTLKITAKQFGSYTSKFTLEIESVRTLTINLVQNTNVNTSLDISSYPSEGAETTDQIYFNYDSAKQQMVFGEIDLSTHTELSKVLLDSRLTTFDALKWVHEYESDDLDGVPYQIHIDRVFVNEDEIEFIRAASLTSAQHSRLGVACFLKDKVTTYVPEHSNNDRVEIDNLSSVTVIDRQTTIDVVSAVTQSPDFIDNLAGAVADAVAEGNEGILDRIDDNSSKARKQLTNRRKIDTDQNTLTTYDDDGSTAITTKNLTDADGNPTSREPFEESPA